MPNNLFILKGKKGELNYLSKEMRRNIENQSNIFIIDSNIPRLLKQNQFEDLIKVCDLLISMSHTSTTIWQFLANNKPAIAVNENHPHSFLKEYEYFEVNLSQLSDAVIYWLEISDKKWFRIHSNISKRVNLKNSNGVNEIGRRADTNQIVIKIDPKYFRPTEVELLLGDATKAKEKLGWETKTTFEQLIEMMVESDLAIVQEAVDGGYAPPTPPE